MPRSIGGQLAGLAVCFLLLWGASPAALAQDRNDAFPLVSGGGPPDWVTPGLRLSYYGEAASIRTSYYTYVEDENGDWEDPVTHKRYRRTEEGEMPEAAGRAYTQSDVIAVEGDDVVMSTTMYGIDIETGLLSLIPLWGGRYAGAAVDGAWVRPDLLASVATGGTPDLGVLRGPYELDGTRVEAVAFMSKAEGTYASTVFDAVTGAQVAYTGRAKGPGSPVHGPIDNPEGNVIVAWARLIGVRQRDVPGVGQAVPDWVMPGLTLRYAGATTVTNPFDPYGFEKSDPTEVSVTLDEVGPGWATFHSETMVDFDGYVERTDASGATGAAGQFWIVPAVLGQLSPGDVLEDDPVTGARLTVDAADAGEVILRTEMPGVSATATYDVGSGAMTAMTIAGPYVAMKLQLTSIR